MAALDHARVDRGDQILVRGNRLILHAVFQDENVRRYRDPSFSEAEIANAATTATEHAFLRIAQAVKERHTRAYLQPLLKNAQRCKEMLAGEPDNVQGDMFPYATRQ
jgi:hypothetical protein